MMLLRCIACSKRIDAVTTDDDVPGTSKSPAVKNLTSQLKDMALKLSGSKRHSKRGMKSVVGLGSSTSTSTSAWNSPNTSKRHDHFLGAADSSTKGAAPFEDMSGPVVQREKGESSREWFSQVETGVLLTLVSLNGGGNDIKRIRFSRELFDKCQAQRWWIDNREKVFELYNVSAPEYECQQLPEAHTEAPQSGGNSLQTVLQQTDRYGGRRGKAICIGG